MTDAVRSGARPGEGKAEHREGSPLPDKTSSRSAPPRPGDADGTEVTLLTLVQSEQPTLGNDLKEPRTSWRGSGWQRVRSVIVTLLRRVVDSGRRAGEHFRAGALQVEWSSLRTRAGRWSTERVRLLSPHLGTSPLDPGVVEPDDLLLYLDDPAEAYAEQAATVMAIERTRPPAWKEWLRRGAAAFVLISIGIVIGVITSVAVVSVTNWVSQMMVGLLQS
jgi:hypothetical protein